MFVFSDFRLGYRRCLYETAYAEDREKTDSSLALIAFQATDPVSRTPRVVGYGNNDDSSAFLKINQ